MKDYVAVSIKNTSDSNLISIQMICNFKMMVEIYENTIFQKIYPIS